MKIAVYHNLHSGGALRVLCEILKRIGDRHQLDLYDLSSSDHKFCDLNQKIQNHYTYPFKPLPDLKKPFGRLNYIARLIDLYRVDNLQRKIAVDIDRKNYDLVYMHHCQFTQAPSILQYLRTPSLYHCHEPLRAAYEPPVRREYNRKNRISKFLDAIDIGNAMYRQKRKGIDRAGTLSASRVIVNSYYTRESVYRVYGIDARVLHPAIDANLFRHVNFPQRAGILSVGALTPLKGFDFVIRSIGLIPTELRPELIIASNYQEVKEKSYLQRLSVENGVNLQLRDRITDEDLVRLYNQVKLVVCSSVMEPFGLVPLEAMACATPVIAVAEGGLRETVIPNQTGLLIDRDPELCAKAIIQLLSDDDLCDNFGRNGRSLVEKNWGWERVTSQLESYLADLAGSK
jgi:glycosyltransferase involved in cell wall biosynthesis